MNLEESLREVENGVSGVVENNPAFDIVVKNAASEAKTNLYVTSANTLRQVFEGTATDLGFDLQKNNNIYINEKTNQSTTDPDITLKEFQVSENTLISIQQDGKVAAQ